MKGGYSLRKIDFLTLFDHPSLDLDDDCYYFMEYPRGGIEVNRGNPVVSFIMNFKKSVLRRGMVDWKYKIQAINEVAKGFYDFLPQEFGHWDSFSLVPIPPSKRRDHAEYDDRMIRSLSLICNNVIGAQALDIFQNSTNLHPSHLAESRPTKDNLESNLQLDPSLVSQLRGTVILFDDVITTGSHFKACKNALLKINPNLRIIGIFIARTVS